MGESSEPPASADAGATDKPLPLEEVQRLVELAAPAVRLEVDDAVGAVHDGRGAGKGRYLVARRAIKAGEVVLAEWPLYHGSIEAAQSRLACVEHFAALASVLGGEGDTDSDEDRLHPRSPIVDCVAGILLDKQRAVGTSCASAAQREEARLRLRKLRSLCMAPSMSLPREISADMLGVLLPELQALTSEAELQDIVQILSSNRFGSADAQLDVMFAGSMFEHSCAANCFVGGTWRARLSERPREYRALRDIAPGEALSIDYVLLPGTYMPAAARAELLSGWGFTCSCPRCAERPEVTRSFMCPSCELPELCPRRPRVPAPCVAQEPKAVPDLEPEEMVCQACGRAAAPEYVARCVGAEVALEQCRSSGSQAPVPPTGETYDGLIGRYHHAVFSAAWQRWNEGPDIEDEVSFECLEEYREMADIVIDCITRLYGEPLHPQLLLVYHSRALLAQNSLDEQRNYLELERQLLRRFYPEEADRQDAEIMHMVTHRGPPGAAAAGGAEASAEAAGGTPPMFVDGGCGNGPPVVASAQDAPIAAIAAGWNLSHLD